MNQDFIQLEHRDSIKTLMDILGIGMQEAYELYVTSNYNIQHAINNKIIPNSRESRGRGRGRAPQRHQFDYDSSFLEFSGGHSFTEKDPKFTQYKNFILSGKSFDVKYNFRKQTVAKDGKVKRQKTSNTIDKYLIQKSQRKSQKSKQLNKYLTQFAETTFDINIKHSSIAQALYDSWKDRFPVAILFIDFSSSIKPILKSIMNDKYIVEQVFNRHFSLCCTQIKKYILQPWLKPFINQQKDKDSLIIARVNILDQIQIIHKFQLKDIEIEKFKKQIKIYKTECIQKELDQMHIVKEHNQIRKGNREYQRPKCIIEKIALRQDQRLKQQQDDAFLKACQAKKQRNSSVKKKQAKLDIEYVKRQRQEKKKNLNVYEKGLHMKLRLPSGKNELIIVSQDQKIDYIFKYVECMIEDIGFENDLCRNFDILRVEDRSSLAQKRDLLIKDLLSESQVLIVKEIQP